MEEKSLTPTMAGQSMFQVCHKKSTSILINVTNDMPENVTYSVDLSTSWTNQTIRFNRIPKTAPVLNYVALWADSTNSSFYAWAGEVNKALPVPQNSVWKFTPSSGGFGSWSEQSMPSNSIFPSLTRPAGAISAYGNGVGYLLGGYETAWTTPQTAGLEALVPTPGIISYDIDARVWKNESAVGYSAYGTAMFGQMQFVPHIGKDGLLIVLGGATSDVVNWEDRGTNYISFQNINMFDPASRTWHNQIASGAIPNSRLRSCVVGVQGDSGTYEIFIYGGHVASASGETQASDTAAQRHRNIELDEVFVLSLPGFVWMKANYTAANPRISHTCNIAGNRQMVVTGGLNPASRNTSELYSSRDIWTQGIGVFDLTTMQWKNTYDADAKPYVTPNAVKSWYATNGPYPTAWDDPVVEGFFTQSSTSSPTSDGDSDAGSPKDDSGSSSPNAGAIAGGIVGGVVGLALIMASFWLFRRFRPRAGKPRPGSTGGTNMESKAELGNNPLPPNNMNNSHRLPELEQPRVILPELEQPRVISPEASGSHPRYEML